MVDEAALRNFYQTKLIEKLQAADLRRKGAIRKIVFWLAGAVAAVGLVWGLASGVAAFFAALVAGFAVAIVIGLNKDSYAGNYKAEVLSDLVPFLEPGLRYAQSEELPYELLAASGLYQAGRAGKYRCEDLVAGSVAGRQVWMGEVLVQEVERRQGRNGRRDNRHHSLLEGLALVVELDAPVAGTTVVLPDLAEKVLGSFLGGMLQKSLPELGSRVQVADQAFERQFAVFSTEPDQAQTLLTQKLVRGLTQMQERQRDRLLVSVTGKHVLLVFRRRTSVFRPSLFRSPVKFDLVKRSAEQVRLLAELADLVAPKAQA